MILESMKMEMPVEAEDEGTVAEILVEEGQSVQEGDPSSSCRRWARVVVDAPADGVARLTIANPAKRNALDRGDPRRARRRRCRRSTRAASC